MQKELRWRVVYGYDNSEYIQIGEDLLEKAKYSMITGKILSANGKMIKGSEIKRIEPDYRYYTGWNDGYDYGGYEDRLQIERDCPLKEINERYELADNRVRYAITNKKENLLLTEPNKILI